MVVESLKSAIVASLHTTDTPSLWSSVTAVIHDFASLTFAVRASSAFRAAGPAASIAASSMHEA